MKVYLNKSFTSSITNGVSPADGTWEPALAYLLASTIDNTLPPFGPIVPSVALQAAIPPGTVPTSWTPLTNTNLPNGIFQLYDARRQNFVPFVFKSATATMGISVMTGGLNSVPYAASILSNSFRVLAGVEFGIPLQTYNFRPVDSIGVGGVILPNSILQTQNSENTTSPNVTQSLVNGKGVYIMSQYAPVTSASGKSQLAMATAAAVPASQWTSAFTDLMVASFGLSGFAAISSAIVSNYIEIDVPGYDENNIDDLWLLTPVVFETVGAPGMFHWGTVDSKFSGMTVDEHSLIAQPLTLPVGVPSVGAIGLGFLSSNAGGTVETQVLTFPLTAVNVNLGIGCANPLITTVVIQASLNAFSPVNAFQ